MMKNLAHPRRHVSSPERAGGAIFFFGPKFSFSAALRIVAVFLVVLVRIPSPQSG
jgi:hypothetical protein